MYTILHWDLSTKTISTGLCGFSACSVRNAKVRLLPFRSIAFFEAFPSFAMHSWEMLKQRPRCMPKHAKFLG
jgi:hypothetical protein